MERPAYRAALLGRNVGIMMLAVIIVAAAFPQINPYAMSLLCLALILAAFVYHLGVDRTLILSGQFLRDDGEALYTVIGTFNLGVGRRHFQNKQIRLLRYCVLEKVKMVKEYPFGIAVRAEVFTATSKDISVTDEVFQTPGAMKALLEEKGKRKTVLFRVERNLTEESERALLERLRALREA